MNRPVYFVAFAAAALATAIAANYRSLAEIPTWNFLQCRTAVPAGTFLAYCHSPGYNDYEHGAYYFEIEAEAVTALRRADVVFVGNSRVQHAFSTEAMSAAARRDGYSFYVFGMGYNEMSEFYERAFAKLSLTPKAIVVSVDPFFDPELSAPAARVVADQWQSRLVYRWKRWLSENLEVICSYAASLCAPAWSVAHRRTDNGMWVWKNYNYILTDGSWPVPANFGLKVADTTRDMKVAERFFDRIGVPRDCIVLTSTPGQLATPEFAQEVARKFGLRYINPAVEGMATLDKSHLRYESAQRWSAAFLDEAGPVLRRCASRL